MSKKKAKKTLKLNFDDKNLDELQDMANELETTPEDIMNKAFYLFRFMQGRQLILKQKNGKKYKIKDFEDKKQRIE